MGQLRLVPKDHVLNSQEYRRYYEILKNALSAADQGSVFYDLDPDENKSETRKHLLMAATREQIPLKVRAKRNEHCLELIFGKKPKAGMDRDTYASKILEVINRAEKPLSRGEILMRADIGNERWGSVIKDLVRQGLIKRQGDRRDTVYERAN